MCMTAICGSFFNANPRDFICPCGYAYWDVFQDFFLDAQSRKTDGAGRAIPMEDEESKIRRQISPMKFEAGLRTKFATHCIDCGMKARLRGTSEPIGFDDEGLRRALTELLQISQGDYQSRGLSVAASAAQPSLPFRTSPEPATQPQNHPSDAQPSHLSHPHTKSQPVSDSTANHRTIPPERGGGPDLTDKSKQDTKSPLLPPPSAPTPSNKSAEPDLRSTSGSTTLEKALTKSKTQRSSTTDKSFGTVPSRKFPSKVARSDKNDDDVVVAEENQNNDDDPTEDGHPPHATTQSQNMVRPYQSQQVNRGRKMRLPAKGIRREVLENHQQLGTFGTWVNIERQSQKGKKSESEQEPDTFEIELGTDTQPLSSKDIAQLIRESDRFEAKLQEPASSRSSRRSR